MQETHATMQLAASDLISDCTEIIVSIIARDIGKDEKKTNYIYLCLLNEFKFMTFP